MTEADFEALRMGYDSADAMGPGVDALPDESED